MYANYTESKTETRGMLIPPLVEVCRTAPYLHDGSAATVKDVLTTRNLTDTHGNVSELTESQLDDLCNYVLSLGTDFASNSETVIYENITVIETTVNMSSASATDTDAVISLKKGSAVLELLRVNGETGELMIPDANGSFVKLYDNKGTALKVSADIDTAVVVIYNDIIGTARYYVGQPDMSLPYYASGEAKVLADGIASGNQFKSEFGTEGESYYVIAKPYTLVGETKYYGEAVKIDIASDGSYSFDETYGN